MTIFFSLKLITIKDFFYSALQEKIFLTEVYFYITQG